MFGMILSVMVYGIIVAIAGWMLGLTFMNIAGFITSLVHGVRIVTPVIVRGSRFAMTHAIRPAARTAYRFAAPHVALATRRIAAAAARAAATAELASTSGGTVANR